MVMIGVFVLLIGWVSDVSAKTIIPLTSNVYVDEKKVEYPVKPILQDGTTLVPLRETFQAMGASIAWDAVNKKVTAKNGNREVILIIDSNVAYIDGESVQLAAPAIIYQRKTMIPLRFVGEAFGGTVTHHETTKNIMITIPKFNAEFLPVKEATILNVKNVEGTEMKGNRRLMVSDHPEILSNNTVGEPHATLWHDIVVDNTASRDHRVFAWHINHFSENIVLGITIENRSKTNVLQLENAKGIYKKSQNTWYEHDIGLPLAESLLSNRIQNIPLLKDTILPGETVGLGWYEMNPNDALGLLNDFTVTKSSGTGRMDYVIRTVVSSVHGDDLTKIKKNPVPIDEQNMHSRGVWPSSDLTVTLPQYEIGVENEIAYNISNGHTDDLLKGSESLVNPNSSISNKGHYGVVYKVSIPYINKSNEEKTIHVRIGSRGGDYSGAVKTKYGVYNIPNIRAMKDVVVVLEEKIEPCQCTGYMELDIVHAGGANLPIAINVITVE